MVVYISGPISLGGKLGEDEQDAFKQAFQDQEDRLTSLGHEVINPCKCERQSSWEDYMRIGLSSVCVSDIIGVLPRWLESKGSVLEVYVAHQLGIPVVTAAEIA